MGDHRGVHGGPWWAHGEPWVAHGGPMVVHGGPTVGHGWPMVGHGGPMVSQQVDGVMVALRQRPTLCAQHVKALTHTRLHASVRVLSFSPEGPYVQ